MKDDLNEFIAEKPIKPNKYEIDHILVMDPRNFSIVSASMVVSNTILTIVAAYLFVFKNEVAMAILVILATSFAGIAEKIFLHAIERHDVSVMMQYNTKMDYYKRMVKQYEEREKNIKKSKIVLMSDNPLNLFKEEIHNAAINDPDSNNNNPKNKRA